MKKELYIGIDTSNYTTSLAILDGDGHLVANLKRPLPVKEGECGLRQSDAVFHHTVNVPSLMEEARAYLSDGEVMAIGVSEKPRNTEGSYMPCFLVGCSVAKSLSSFLSVPVYGFSHQCGHIMAALYSSENTEIPDGSLAAFHVSGGTTELVRVSPCNGGFLSELVGGTADLNAGQVIDRIGVRMGLPFPAGRHLEELAKQNTKRIPKKKISRKDLSINLSGLENMADKLLLETEDKALVAAFVFDYIGRALAELMEEYERINGACRFLFAGGVMCNSIVRSIVARHADCLFADPMLSADNAVGTAALAFRKHKTEK